MANNNGSFSNMFRVPKRFTYKSIICELLNINRSIGDFAIFELKPMRSFNFFEEKEQIENDPFFRFMIAICYRCCIQHIQLTMEVDQINNESHVYASIKTVPAPYALQNYTQSMELFSEEIGRYTSAIVTGSFPFTFHGVESDNEDEMEFDVRGHVAYRCSEPARADNFMKSIEIYSVVVNVTIANWPEIVQYAPKYQPANHHRLIYECIFTALQNCEAAIRERISPTGFLKIKFDYMAMNDDTALQDGHLCMRIALIPRVFNGWEVAAISPSLMTLRPYENTDQFFDAMPSLNWPDMYRTIQSVATALLSDRGTLLTPVVVDHDVEIFEGSKWLTVQMMPRLANFTGAFVHYGDTSTLERAAQEFVYVVTDIRNSNIQIIFPTLARVSEPDVLAYLRFPAQMLATVARDGIISSFIANITCPELGIRVCAESSYWCYCALVDRTVPMHKYPDFLKVDNTILPVMGVMNNQTLEDVAKVLIGLFADSPHALIPYHNLDPELKQKAIDLFGKDDPYRIAISAWETAFLVHNRPWYNRWADAIDSIFMEADEIEQKCASMHPEQPAEMPLIKSTMDLTEDIPMDTIKPLEPEDEGIIKKLIGRLFGHN